MGDGALRETIVHTPPYFRPPGSCYARTAVDSQPQAGSHQSPAASTSWPTSAPYSSSTASMSLSAPTAACAAKDLSCIFGPGSYSIAYALAPDLAIAFRKPLHPPRAPQHDSSWVVSGLWFIVLGPTRVDRGAVMTL